MAAARSAHCHFRMRDLPAIKVRTCVVEMRHKNVTTLPNLPLLQETHTTT
jgi:hypothetical protein